MSAGVETVITSARAGDMSPSLADVSRPIVCSSLQCEMGGIDTRPYVTEMRHLPSSGRLDYKIVNHVGGDVSVDVQLTSTQRQTAIRFVGILPR